MDNPNQQPSALSETDLKSSSSKVYKNHHIILIVSIVIAIFILSIGVYIVLKLQSIRSQPTTIQATPTSTTAISPAPNGDMANWKTYINTEKGYSIAFPKEQFVRIDCAEKEFRW